MSTLYTYYIEDDGRWIDYSEHVFTSLEQCVAAAKEALEKQPCKNKCVYKLLELIQTSEKTLA